MLTDDELKAIGRIAIRHALVGQVVDLRHTAASRAIHSGASIVAVSKMLGHSKPSITLDIYTDQFEDEQKELAGRMEALYRPSIAASLLPGGPASVS